MRRYARLYLCFLRFSFSRAMEFRVDFFFRIFMDAFFYFINIAFFKVVFLHTSLLGGWGEEQMMVFVGCDTKLHSRMCREEVYPYLTTPGMFLPVP